MLTMIYDSQLFFDSYVFEVHFCWYYELFILFWGLAIEKLQVLDYITVCGRRK